VPPVLVRHPCGGEVQVGSNHRESLELMRMAFQTTLL
jgi:hypothetical protein